MNETKVIKTSEVLGKQFTIYGTSDEPLFLAKDVANWIEHSNVTEMLRGVDEDEKLNSTILSAGQNREVSMLTENGLYEVLMLSRKPIAKQFKKEVKVILKSIRKDGAYIQGEENLKSGELSEEEFILKAMTILQSKVERITKERDEALMLVNQKQKELETITIDVQGTFDWAQTAQIISDNGYTIGRNNLCKTLRNMGILKDNNTPYQRYMKYFDVKMKSVNKRYRTELIPVTRVYGSGIDYIYKQLITNVDED